MSLEPQGTLGFNIIFVFSVWWHFRIVCWNTQTIAVLFLFSAQLESSAYNLGKLYISKSLFWLHTQPWKDCRGRSGLRLVSVDQEPPHLDVFRNGATTVTFPPCASSHSWTRDKDRNMLPGLRRQEQDCFSVSQQAFHMKEHFPFHLEIKDHESILKTKRILDFEFLWS